VLSHQDRTSQSRARLCEQSSKTSLEETQRWDPLAGTVHFIPFKTTHLKYYSVMKKEQNAICVSAQMNFKSIILSERSQAQKITG
jgi:hypothetical protein